VSFEVPIACPCPGTPHPDGDTVSLREKLGLAAGIAIQRMVIDANQNRPDTAELTGKLAEGYLLHGVEAWTLVGENGGAVPVNETTIRQRLLDDFTVAAPIADAADKLYMAAVILPLVNGAQTSSPSTPTNGSTSRPRSGTSKRPKPSKQSSTTTTLTELTETTSPVLAGASRS
jgi:hypothetical protein